MPQADQKLCRGGLYNRYSVNHEAFVWKIRTYVLSRWYFLMIQY